MPVTLRIVFSFVARPNFNHVQHLATLDTNFYAFYYLQFGLFVHFKDSFERPNDMKFTAYE